MTSLNSLKSTHLGIANEKLANIVEVMDADEPIYFQGDHIYSLEYQYAFCSESFSFRVVFSSSNNTALEVLPPFNSLVIMPPPNPMA